MVDCGSPLGHFRPLVSFVGRRHVPLCLGGWIYVALRLSLVVVMTMGFDYGLSAGYRHLVFVQVQHNFEIKTKNYYILLVVPLRFPNYEKVNKI